MPKTVDPDDLLSGIRSAVTKEVVAKVRAAILSALDNLDSAAPKKRAKRGSKRAVGLVTKWIADKTARRVPFFVQKMTGGLKVKADVIAKFGEGAKFEDGKPLPSAKGKKE